MGYKYTIKGWNHNLGTFYFVGSDNFLVALWLYIKIPPHATLKTFEGR